MKKLICLCAVLLLLSGCAGKGRKPSVGWQSMDGMQYYYTEDGSLLTGWQTIEENRYYFAADGHMLTGWLEIGGERYWLGETGIPATGWQEVEGARRYFREDGRMARGNVTIGSETYRFSEDGTAAEGVVETDAGLRYFREGKPLTGWIEAGDSRYYAGSDGILHTGWLTRGEYRYYFFDDGTMAVGPREVEGDILYFTPSGIHLWLANPWNEIHDGYTVDLVQVDEYFTVDRSCYTALMQMLNACAEAGYDPMICSGYRTQADQEYLFDRKVKFYLDEGLDEETARWEAGKSVALPGTSEHQLGLAVDIVSADYYVLDDSQATTKTQQWLMAHCWEYGFILRYPENTVNITGIIYEPWHYRYVGVEVAMELRELGITLEEYLGDLGVG